MKVCFVSLTFPDNLSPAHGTYNLELCAALHRRHQVDVVAPRSWHEWFKVRRAGKRYAASPATLRANLAAAFPVYWYLPRFGQSMLGLWLWWSIRSQARSTRKPDAVISYWAYPDGAAGLAMAKDWAVPSIVIVGGSDVLLLPLDERRGVKVVDVLSNSSMVVTVSEGLRRATIALGVPPERVRTIYQGINPEVFCRGDRQAARQRLSLPADAEILLWVGRMVAVKNLEMLVEVVLRLVTTHPRLQLCLVGYGEARAGLEKRVMDAGLSERIRFVGPVTQDLLPEWYRAANVTVMSSTSEGIPNTLRESLACGTPFVSTDVGSIGELAPPDLARLVPSGDVRAFAVAVDELLQRPNQQIDAAYAPRTWDMTADEMIALIADLRR